MSRALTKRLAISGVAAAVLVGVAIWWWPRRQAAGPTAGEIAAPLSSAQANVRVGPNVHVSGANGSTQHFEPLIVADPAGPERLFAVAILDPPATKGAQGVVGYFSEDGGKTWVATFGGPGDPKNRTGDPALAFGPDGNLYLVRLRIDDTATTGQGKTIDFGDKSGVGFLDFFRSTDRGKTWQPTGIIQQYTDRPWLVVDNTNTKHRGRLYCPANIRDIVLHTSDDGGKTFAPPCLFKPATSQFKLGNAAILSDGGFVGVYDHRDLKDPEVRPQVRILVSDDGGRTLGEGTSVSTNWSNKRITTSNWNFMPQLAVDATSPQYRDRLYAVWEDGPSADVGRIMFAYSKDKGTSWVGPLLLSEHASDIDATKDYGVYIPAIAVNRHGMVAVLWYDRRGFPIVPASRYPAGCNVRLRVSLDRGQTWLPSVQINEQPIKAPIEDLKDTAGLAADANGDFHAAWIDDRTGTRQVWTTRVQVQLP